MKSHQPTAPREATAVAVEEEDPEDLMEEDAEDFLVLA